MDELPNPRPTGRVLEVDADRLRGSLAAWDGDQPVFLGMPGSDLFYLPVFAGEAELRDLFAMLKLEFTSIKRVDDANEFISSFAGTDVVVICNLRFEAGRFRFFELVPAAAGNA